jgi:hypothetical protein
MEEEVVVVLEGFIDSGIARGSRISTKQGGLKRDETRLRLSSISFHFYRGGISPRKQWKAVTIG